MHSKLNEFKQKHYSLYIFTVVIGLIVVLYTILFVFYMSNQDIFTARPKLQRRNAMKPGDIEKILKNIKIMKNLRVRGKEKNRKLDE